jgi:flagellar motor switch protein FliN/FliY
MPELMTAAEEIGHLAGMPIAIEVELDRRIMTLREILELDVGGVVRMGRSAGENVDILAGGRVVGFGEIVIIEEMMGIRVTDFWNEE